MTADRPRVRLLGPFTVETGGRELLLRPAPRAVLAALVLAGRRGMAAADLAGILWGDDQPVAPVAGARAQVEAAAAQLAGPREAPPVERTADGWRLARPVATDVADLRDRVTLARTHLGHGGPARARELLAGDVATAFGTPLADLAAPWFAGQRVALERVLASVLVTYAAACTQDGAPDEAVRLLERGLRVPAFADAADVWEGLVRAHLTADRTDRAREVLGVAARVLGHDPERVDHLRDLVDRGVGTPLARRIAERTEQRPAPTDRPTPLSPDPAPAPDPGPDPGPAPGWGTPARHRSERDAALHRLSRSAEVVVPPRRSGPMGPATWAQPADLPPGAPAARAVRPPTPLRFRVFGPRRIVRPDDPVRMDAGYLDAVLAVLLVRRGTAVGLDELAAAVWGDDLPLRPRTAVEVNLAGLAEACGTSPLPVVALDGPAWRLDAPPDAVDHDAAVALVTRGRDDAAAGRTEDAATTLRQALDLVVGTPLKGVEGPWFATERERLERWRSDVVWSCVVAEVSCGRTASALRDLRALAAANPLREDVWEWLVLAAARHEGRAAGLAAYDEAVRHLHRLLGAAPGPALQAVRRRVEAGQA